MTEVRLVTMDGRPLLATFRRGAAGSPDLVVVRDKDGNELTTLPTSALTRSGRIFELKPPPDPLEIGPVDLALLQRMVLTAQNGQRR